MSFTESVLIALFCMAVVFAVLGLLWAVIRVFSIAIQAIESKKTKSSSGV